jgi:cobalt-zinc-cadmium resistance protein CzcA
LTSLLLSLTFMPAAASLLLRAKDILAVQHAGRRCCFASWRTGCIGPCWALLTLAWPKLVGGAGAAAAGSRSGACLLRAGSEFVPQLDEGDLVIQTTRAPDISLPSGG